MAYWGQALALLDNPFSAPPAKNLAEGLAKLEEARKIGARTQRETDYIDALLVLFRGYDTVDHRTRVLAFERTKKELAARYPDDPEAGIYHALALDMAASPNDKTYANQIEAARILEAEWRRQPDHPGVAHYLIHTYDFPPLAEQGLTAARRYSAIAPDAPHALHMPSHIFTRVGHWEQSVASNGKSAEVARKDGLLGDEFHALDYMVYAYLQMGQDGSARQIVDDRVRVAEPDRVSLVPSASFARAAMPARLALERGAWNEAANLEVIRTSYPFADSLTHYARAIGLARSGQPDRAAGDIEALKALATVLEGMDLYWMEQIEIQHQAAEAWVAFAKGDREVGLAGLRNAADREARTEKHVVTPGPLAPAREQLAEMLLEMNRPGEALAEFEAVRRTEPRRFRATFGAVRAADLAGDRERAKQLYGQLIEIVGAADTSRPEVTVARTYVADAR
jgi:hypothetical protein